MYFFFITIIGCVSILTYATTIKSFHLAQYPNTVGMYNQIRSLVIGNSNQIDNPTMTTGPRHCK